MSDVSIVFQRVEQIGDVTHGTFDVLLPTGYPVTVAAFVGRSGRLVFGRGSLAQIVDRDTQCAVAGAVRRALSDHVADLESA